MKTRTIGTPTGWKPADLIRMIESTPDAFTEGRRNNDMVNWYLAKAIEDMTDRGKIRWVGDYIAEFNDLVDNFNPIQYEDVHDWEHDYEDKLRDLSMYYGSATDTGYLSQLWLPMPYSLV